MTHDYSHTCMHATYPYASVCVYVQMDRYIYIYIYMCVCVYTHVDVDVFRVTCTVPSAILAHVSKLYAPV